MRNKIILSCLTTSFILSLPAHASDPADERPIKRERSISSPLAMWKQYWLDQAIGQRENIFKLSRQNNNSNSKELQNLIDNQTAIINRLKRLKQVENENPILEEQAPKMDGIELLIKAIEADNKKKRRH